VIDDSTEPSPGPVPVPPIPDVTPDELVPADEDQPTPLPPAPLPVVPIIPSETIPSEGPRGMPPLGPVPGYQEWQQQQAHEAAHDQYQPPPSPADAHEAAHDQYQPPPSPADAHEAAHDQYQPPLNPNRHPPFVVPSAPPHGTQPAAAGDDMLTFLPLLLFLL
jgi:hypothetical protein